MKKNILYVTLFAATLFACGSDSSDSSTSLEGISDDKVEMTFNMPEKEAQQLINATGELTDRYGYACLTFEGDNGEIEIFISSTELEEREYSVDVEDLNTKNALASYTIKSGKDKNYCCGKSMDVKSVGSITITSISSDLISGNLSVDNYDGGALKGSFSISK
ncbi:MAG: hypothetical protein JKY30_04350 [Flavobacteriales bacterium]|nr:hypothetical protein [Flavobacteriales bacterium]